MSAARPRAARDAAISEYARTDQFSAGGMTVVVPALQGAENFRDLFSVDGVWGHRSLS
jgi:hypothetical protein